MAELLNMPHYTQDLFDLPVFKSILLLVLPLELDVETGLRMKECESKHLWPPFKKILSPHISNLSQEIIDDDVHFPYLFYSFMQVQIATEEKDRAMGIINTAINDVPDQFNYFTVRNRQEAIKCLKCILSSHCNNKHKEDYKKLGIILPPGYMD